MSPRCLLPGEVAFLLVAGLWFPQTGKWDILLRVATVGQGGFVLMGCEPEPRRPQTLVGGMGRGKVEAAVTRRGLGRAASAPAWGEPQGSTGRKRAKGTLGLGRAGRAAARTLAYLVCLAAGI